VPSALVLCPPNLFNPATALLEILEMRRPNALLVFFSTKKEKAVNTTGPKINSDRQHTRKSEGFVIRERVWQVCNLDTFTLFLPFLHLKDFRLTGQSTPSGGYRNPVFTHCDLLDLSNFKTIINIKHKRCYNAPES